ncbi:hypothetical protein GCM10027053_47910 [Intrasporangium mesophilum]
MVAPSEFAHRIYLNVVGLSDQRRLTTSPGDKQTARRRLALHSNWVSCLKVQDLDPHDTDGGG